MDNFRYGFTDAVPVHLQCYKPWHNIPIIDFV